MTEKKMEQSMQFSRGSVVACAPAVPFPTGRMVFTSQETGILLLNKTSFLRDCDWQDCLNSLGLGATISAPTSRACQHRPSDGRKFVYPTSVSLTAEPECLDHMEPVEIRISHLQ